ncbi:Type I restriction endonuclease, DNA specifity subunit S [[Mycoplasma] cavipharyngis]|uniref:restriction endonuclease subunit S n=1 Tax=[Mycoplasma] cavipharyngis TaxID=92757 RepID=UPI0037040B78
MNINNDTLRERERERERERAGSHNGIVWLDQIPSGWKCKKLKYLCDISNGNKFRQDNDPNGIYPLYVNSNNILKINDWTHDTLDILTPGGGDVGNVWHYVNGKFSVHTDVFVIDKFKNNQIFSKFLFYYLKGTFNKQPIIEIRVSFVHLRPIVLKNFPILIPSLDEQKNIVNYLDQKLNYIDQLIKNNLNLIDQLEQYKKSLIFKIVTKGINFINNLKIKLSKINKESS